MATFYWIAACAVCLFGGVGLGATVVRDVMTKLIFSKFEAAAWAIKPVTDMGENYGKGARKAAEAIFGEFGVYYNDGK